MLAERARMSLAAIGKLERGARQRPYRATVALLADALSLSPHERLELERAAERSPQKVSTPPRQVAAATNLPIHFSSFVGRERDLAKVREMLAAHRLVTLVGPGGVGKTRLAVRVAEDFVAANPTGVDFDGVWFADLSSLTDGAMVAMALASSVGLDQCRTLEGLVTYLRSQTFLLILDNCEHLLDATAHALKALESACPGAWILATSRQALSLEGERIYRVPPLSVPPGDLLSAADALEFDAIRLFKDRAEAADSRFELTDSLVSKVAEICRRVDGIALCIELAAARTNAFTPAVIARQLGEHFFLLAGGIRTSLPRHRTVRALFDWSYELLDERERELLRRCSIFAGGFTLDLVCALYAGNAEKGEIPSLIASLVDKSLVHCDILVGPRYRLLEPARQYAQEKLREKGEQTGAARLHAIALLDLAEDFDARQELIPDREWDEYIERERDNFRATFEWAFGPGGDATLGLRLTASKSATWAGFASGEVRRWVTAAHETRCETTPPQGAAKLAINAARAAVLFGPSWQSESNLETRVDACRRALSLQAPDDPRAVATAQYWLGVALLNVGRRDEASEALREARVTASSVGALNEYNAATTTLGMERYGAGDFEEARALVSEALQRSEDAGSNRAAADARACLAEIEFAAGRIERALELTNELTQFQRSHARRVGLPMTLSNSAAYLIALGRYQEARDDALEALWHSRAIASVEGPFWVMQHLAAIAVFDIKPSENEAALQGAAKVLGFVDEATRRRGKRRYNTEQQEYDKMLSILRETFGEARLEQLMAAGKAWSEEQAIAVATTL